MEKAKEIEAKRSNTAKFWKSMAKCCLLITSSSLIGFALVGEKDERLHSMQIINIRDNIMLNQIK
jgi:hypothetical protein